MRQSPRDYGDSRQTFLGSRIYKNESASASLYLTWSCERLLADGTLKRLSPTVFKHGDTLIVIRHLSGLSAVPKHRRLLYVIDDNWRDGLSDKSLPLAYRLQLASEFLRRVPAIERKASTIFVASEHLAEAYQARFRDKDVRLIAPAWPEATTPLAQDRPKSLAVLSAGTHRQDGRFLIPVLEEVWKHHPDIHLTLSHSFEVPPGWKDKHSLTALPSMGWSEYLDWMQDRRFDVMLYPLLETPFNAGRSANKLGESDQFGAALIASESWHEGRNAAKNGRCALVKNTQSQWIERILSVLETPGSANSLAMRNRSQFTEDPPLFSQNLLWSGLLTS